MELGDATIVFDPSQAKEKWLLMVAMLEEDVQIRWSLKPHIDPLMLYDTKRDAVGIRPSTLSHWLPLISADNARLVSCTDKMSFGSIQTSIWLFH
jgi:hypothetical protein